MRELIEAAEMCVRLVGRGITLARTELMKSLAEGGPKVLHGQITDLGDLIEYLRSGMTSTGQHEGTGAVWWPRNRSWRILLAGAVTKSAAQRV